MQVNKLNSIIQFNSMQCHSSSKSTLVINFRLFRGFSAKSRKFEPAKYNFCQIYRKILKTPKKMKEICPKKGKTAKIDTREMRFFRISFRPRKLVPAKISSLKGHDLLQDRNLFRNCLTHKLGEKKQTLAFRQLNRDSTHLKFTDPKLMKLTKLIKLMFYSIRRVCKLNVPS